MKIGTYTQLRVICILSLAASFGLTGCKAGSWKMPKMSWNREPSATTLAGSETPKLPESPANKYTPSTIASVGAGTSPGSSSGNKAPTNGYAGQTSSTTPSATTGLAASANGYQTGPYTLGQRPGSTSTQPSSLGSPSNVASSPNPYGGSYAGMTSAKPADSTTGAGVKGALANYPAPNASTGYGSSSTTLNTQIPGAVGGSSMGATNQTLGNQAPGSAYAGSVPSMPQLPTSPNSFTAPTNYNAPSTGNTYPNLPPIPTIATGTTPSAAPQVSVPSYPGTTPTQPTAGQTSVGTYTAGNTSSASQPSNRYSGVYQPGTTSRPTTYNFGSVTPAQATTPSVSVPQLPPNTASNPSNELLR